MYSLAIFPLNEMLFKTEKTVLLPDMFLVCLQGIAIYFGGSELVNAINFPEFLR